MVLRESSATISDLTLRFERSGTRAYQGRSSECGTYEQQYDSNDRPCLPARDYEGEPFHGSNCKKSNSETRHNYSGQSHRHQTDCSFDKSLGNFGNVAHGLAQN